MSKAFIPAIAALVLTIGQQVYAAELFSPPILLTAAEEFGCHIVNSGPVDRKIKIDIMRADGTIKGTTGERNLPTLNSDLITTFSGGVGQLYCRFDVKGNAKDFRAAAQVKEPGVGTKVIVPAE